MRLLARKRPEPGENAAVKEQLASGIELLGSRRRCPGRPLYQLVIPWPGPPFGRESLRVSKPVEPVAQAFFAAEDISLVPCDCHLRLGQQHQQRGEYADAGTDQQSCEPRVPHSHNARLSFERAYRVLQVNELYAERFFTGL